MNISPAEDTDVESDDESMKNFSTIIAQSQSHIKSIENKTEDLYRLKNTVVNSTGEEETATSQELNKIVNQTQQIQSKMKKIIDDLRAELNEEKSEKPDDPEYRIKENLFGAMIKKYQQTCLKFQNVEGEIKNIIETKLVRSAEIALNKNLTEQQKIEVINDPQIIEQMYENKLTGAAHIRLQNVICDLEDRHKDIKKLERSIIQIHNMIIELSKLIELQGEMIDNIDTNIKQAKNDVLNGEKNVEKSEENMKKCSCKDCIIGAIIFVILIIVSCVASFIFGLFF